MTSTRLDWTISEEKRVFRSNTGLVFRHYSLAQFLTFTDVVFDAVKCELKEFLSMNQERKGRRVLPDTPQTAVCIELSVIAYAEANS